MVLWSADWPWEWWQQESFLGLAHTAMKACKGSVESIGAECTYSKTFSLEAQKSTSKAEDPRHALQENGDPADFWCLDDGDILFHPMLVLPSLQAFDTAALKLVKKEIDKRQRSCTTSLIWTLLPLTGRSARSAPWSPQTAEHGNIPLGVAV